MEVDILINSNSITSSTNDMAKFHFYNYLPKELRLLILSFLPTKTLNIACRVCREWYIALSTTQEYWGNRFIPIPCKNSAPPPRVCHASLVVNNSLLIFGGHVPTPKNDYIHKVRGDIWQYSFSTHEWKMLLDGKDIFTETTPILYENSVLIFGGFSGTHVSTLREFNLQTRELKTIETHGDVMNRSAYSAALHKDEVFIFGGWFGRESIDDFDALNLKTHTWRKVTTNTTLSPPPIRSSISFVYKEEMYVWGGYGNKGHLTDLYKFNFDKAEWSLVTTKGKVPSGRSRSRSSICNNKLYIYGGWDRTNLMEDMHELDLEAMTWREIKVEGVGKLCQHSLDTLNSSLILFGGYNGSVQNSLYGFRICHRSA